MEHDIAEAGGYVPTFHPFGRSGSVRRNRQFSKLSNSPVERSEVYVVAGNVLCWMAAKLFASISVMCHCRRSLLHVVAVVSATVVRIAADRYSDIGRTV